MSEQSPPAASAEPPEEPERPVLRVLRGEPTAEELAALLVVVVGARTAGGNAAPRTPRSAWNAPPRLLRKPLAHGPDGWHHSSLPG